MKSVSNPATTTGFTRRTIEKYLDAEHDSPAPSVEDVERALFAYEEATRVLIRWIEIPCANRIELVDAVLGELVYELYGDASHAAACLRRKKAEEERGRRSHWLDVPLHSVEAPAELSLVEEAS